MTKSGKTFVILGVLWKVFLVVIAMHFILLFVQFMVAGTIGHKNPFMLMEEPGSWLYHRIGDPVFCRHHSGQPGMRQGNGVSEQIRNFVIPLCANIHMCGSMITITACATAVCLMNQIPIHLGTVVPFIMTLGIAWLLLRVLLAAPS